jgi:hypothetical protein
LNESDRPTFVYQQPKKQDESADYVNPQLAAKPINFDFTGYDCGDEPTDDDD